jgi:hypothetical protein
MRAGAARLAPHIGAIYQRAVATPLPEEPNPYFAWRR